jgi:tight adherence protein B
MVSVSFCLLGISFFLAASFFKQRFENRWTKLEQERVSSVEEGLSKEFLFIQPARLRKNLRWLLIFGVLLSLVGSSVLPLLFSLVAIWFGPQVILHVIKSRRQKALERQLLMTLPALSATLRAGHTMERSMETLTRTLSPPISQEFELVLKEVRVGITLEQAFANLVERYPIRDLEILLRAIAISRKAGSNLAEALDRVAETIRVRAALRERVMVLTAQGRLQAWTAIGMPIFLTIILQLIAPDYLAPLFQTGLGRFSLCVAAVAMMIGGIWVHRISRREFLT